MAEPAARSGTWVLVATILGSSLAFIDSTVANLMLSTLQDTLGASLADVQWVVEGYALTLSALLLAGGAAGDRYGRRRVFLVGVVAFAGASLLAGLAPGIEVLVAARAVQGVAAAIMVPSSLALVSSAFPRSERNKAIGIWSGFSAISLGIGLAAGGAVIDAFGWRWAFLVNLPVAALAAAVVLLRVPASLDARHGTGAPDLAGAALATVALAGLVWALIEAPARGLGAPLVVASLIVGALAAAGFVWVERRVAHPMLPFHVFKNRPFVGANTFTLFLYAALGGSMFLVPLNLIQVQGWTATQAGLANLPFVVIMASLAGTAGRLADRLGARPVLVAGGLCACAGMALYALAGVDRGYWVGFFPAIVAVALGMTAVIPALTTTAIGALDEEHSGLASGVNNAISRTGGVLAVALCGPLLAPLFVGALASRLDAAGLDASARSAVLDRAGDLGALDPSGLGLDAATSAQVHDGVRQAFSSAFSVATVVFALVGAAGVLAGVALIGRGASRPPAATDPDLVPLGTAQDA